jgi:dTDP-glucose pyrophosphorylase
VTELLVHYVCSNCDLEEFNVVVRLHEVGKLIEIKMRENTDPRLAEEIIYDVHRYGVVDVVEGMSVRKRVMEQCAVPKSFACVVGFECASNTGQLTSYFVDL